MRRHVKFIFIILTLFIGSLPPCAARTLDESARIAEELLEVRPSSTTLRSYFLTEHHVEPLLGNICWGQGEPFNNQCPLDEGAHCMAGCRAVALAQLMHFYQYPDRLMADIPSYTTPTLGIAVDGVESGTPIDWDHILPDYGGDYSQEEGAAVANFISMVGVAAQGDYTSKSTSSRVSYCDVLTRNFGYDADLMRNIYRSSYTLRQWNDLLVEELEAGRPILFAGQSMGGVHAFIVDGVNEEGLYHVNWGWAGKYNGYYNITFLAPPRNDGEGASLTEDGYNQDLHIFTHVVPDNGVEDESDDPMLSVLGLVCQKEAYDGKYYLYFNYKSSRVYRLKYYAGMGYVDKRGKVVCVDPFGEKSFYPNSSIDQKVANALNPESFPQDGVYKLCLLESPDGENWRVAQGAEMWYATFEKRNGELYRVEDEPLLSADLLVTTHFESDGASSCVVELENRGEREYNDRIYVLLNGDSIVPKNYTYATGFSLEPKGRDEIHFSIQTDADSLYYWVADADLRLIGEGLVYLKHSVDLDDVISSVPLDICVEEGELSVTAEEDMPFSLVGMDGKMVRQGELKAHQTLRIQLRGGVYLVNGRRVLVK